MTGNPLSGHTAANQASMTGSGVFTDSLEDGEHITSPSLTNMLEGVHGNGIILEEDTASGDAQRHTPEDLPGVCEQVTNTYTVRIEGGHAVIDGVVYAFAGGPGSTQDVAFTTTSAHKRATYSALASGEEALIVVYVSTDTANQCITWEMGTPVTTASNTYPTTPSAFLSNPKSSGLDVTQSVVLAVIRVVYSASGGDLNLSITESNDKRVFVRPTPMYLTPVTTGAVGATTAVDSHTALDAFNGDTGDFTTSRLGAVWQSYNSDGDAILYYSAKNSGGTRHTHVLGPTGYVSASPSATTTFTFNEGQVFVLNPSTAIQFNPSGTFPEGHKVFVTNEAAHGANSVTFDNAGIGIVLQGKESGMFVYTGSAWKNVMLASGAISPNGHGANGLVQLSDGAGGFTSDANLSWQASPAELTITGKLNVTGLIDPTGLELDPQGANPGGVAANTLWLDSGASNRPKIGSNAVMRASDNISELTNDAGFTDAAAAGAAAPVQSVNTATGAVVLDADDLADGATNVMMTATERAKLTAVETGATADQSASEVPVVATPSNYTASTADVEAHLSGIDTALGAVAVVETDPVFSASEAALLAPGDAVKLAGIEAGAQVNIPLQHMRLYGKNTGADLHTVTAGSRVYLDLGDTSKFAESTTGTHSNITVTSATTDYITIAAGGIYQITAHIGVFPTSSGASDQDVWVEFNTNTSANRELGVIRDRSISAFHNRNLKMSTVVEVPSTDSDMNIYISVLNATGSTIGLRAFDNNRFFFTVTRIGDATV